MDGGAGERDPDSEELSTATLADLQAGLLDAATAARVRRRARSDPEAARILARLDAVRDDLSRLATDAGSAPEVPAHVTARVGAALRRASGTGGHTVDRPALGPIPRVALGAGLLATAAAGLVGILMLTRDPAPAFPPGPTASTITVPDDHFPVPDDELRALLSVPPHLGALADPERLASCLSGLGHRPTEQVLAGRVQQVGGRRAVVLVLADENPRRLTAVVVAPSCSAADPGLLARHSFTRA